MATVAGPFPNGEAPHAGVDIDKVVERPKIERGDLRPRCQEHCREFVFQLQFWISHHKSSKHDAEQAAGWVRVQQRGRPPTLIDRGAISRPRRGIEAQRRSLRRGGE